MPGYYKLDQYHVLLGIFFLLLLVNKLYTILCLDGLCIGRWSPDSRHILTTSEFQLRLTVWSLVSTACVHVPWPKHSSRGVSFTRDGKFVAIATRRDCKDYMNLLSCQGWEAMGTFAVDTSDLADLEWSPTDSTIAVWDSPLEYKVLFRSLPFTNTSVLSLT